MRINQKSKVLFIENLLRLPGIYAFLLKRVLYQKKFLKKELEPELLAFRRKNDGSLTEADFKKLTSYYAMGVPSIFGESLCVLRGYPMSENERLCLSYLGGISGLLDDLFDEPGKSANHLSDFIHSPENLVPGNTHEKLLKTLYIKGLSYSPHPQKIKITATEVFNAQQMSLSQKETQGIPDLRDITFLKGGNSFKYYRLCLANKLQEKEDEMIYQLGGLMQLGNDIFDIRQDTRDGITTLATITSDISLLRENFDRELQKTFTLVDDTAYDASGKKQFKMLISLAIARVFVCLDQFEALISPEGGEFRIKNFSRKQLICDMQKMSNQLKAIHNFLKIPVSS